MSLNPNLWEKQLSPIPYDREKKYDNDSYMEILNKLKVNQNFIAGSIAAEGFFASMFEYRNVPDQLFEAYSAAMENVSQEYTLYDRYNLNVEKGEGSVNGFINDIKGKYSEINFRDTQLKNVQDQFPELGIEKLELYPASNFPGSDIYGLNADGEKVFDIQIKTGDEAYADDVVAAMKNNSDLPFGVSREINNKIAQAYPEYSDRILSGFEPTNLEMHEDVSQGLEILSGNFGIDIPDKIGGVIPLIAEIVLGLKLIGEYRKTKKEYDPSLVTEKRKINALKTILLINRFGLASILAMVGANWGRLGGLFGTMAGAIGGAFSGKYISKKIQPYLLEFSLGILGINNDDLFYYKNKSTIDNISLDFSETASFSF